MPIHLTADGELTCRPPDSYMTVYTLISSIMQFCHEYIDCSNCTNTCCAGLTVYADHVFAHNFLAKCQQTMSRHDSVGLLFHVLQLDNSQTWFLTQSASGRCKFLSSQGKCLIYELRPLVCRLHTCHNCTPAFKQMKYSLYYAYQDALRMEMKALAGSMNPIWTANCKLSNPLLGMTNYEAKIFDILNWSQTALK